MCHFIPTQRLRQPNDFNKFDMAGRVWAAIADVPSRSHALLQLSQI
jgi:hypothetical protein